MLVIWSYTAIDSDHFCIKTILHFPGKILSSDILLTAFGLVQYILSIIIHLSVSDWIPWLKLEHHKAKWETTTSLQSDSEVEQPYGKKQRGPLPLASMSKTQHDSKEQLSIDSISPPPPPMLSLSQLVHKMRKWGHSKGSFGEASNSMCIVKPPAFISTHKDFDELSVHVTAVTSSTSVSEGEFYASFFPEVPLCLLPSPIQLEQPPKPLATSVKPPPISAKLLPSFSNQCPHPPSHHPHPPSHNPHPPWCLWDGGKS